MSIIVAVTGDSGCGKTVLLQNLATLSACEGGYMTGFVSTKMAEPEMQLIFNGTTIEKAYSISRQFWDKDPARMFVPVPRIDRLYVSGIDNDPDTTAVTYTPPDADVLQVGYFNNLRASDFFDVVFVEAPNPLENGLSAIAIENADLVIELVEVSAKGALWFNAYHTFISTLRIENNITSGVLLVGNESWHKIHVKDTAPFFSLAPFIIPFCEEAALGTEQGVPFYVKARKMALNKDEKLYLDRLHALFDYIAHRSPYEDNISIDEYNQPARLYTQPRRTAVARTNQTRPPRRR